MNKTDVKRLSNSKLIKLLLKQNVESTPKPSIKQMEKQSDITIAVTKLFSTKKQSQNHERVLKKWCRGMKIKSSLHHLSIEIGTHQFQHQEPK